MRREIAQPSEITADAISAQANLAVTGAEDGRLCRTYTNPLHRIAARVRFEMK